MMANGSGGLKQRWWGLRVAMGVVGVRTEMGDVGVQMVMEEVGVCMEMKKIYWTHRNTSGAARVLKGDERSDADFFLPFSLPLS